MLPAGEGQGGQEGHGAGADGEDVGIPVVLLVRYAALNFENTTNTYMAVVVKANGIPFWGRCTTHSRTYFSGD